MYLMILYLPLIAAFVSGGLYLVCVYNNKISSYINVVGWLSTTIAMGVTFILSIIILQNIITYNDMQKVPLFNWIVVDHIYILWELKFNILSSVMLVIVSLISFFVFLYSLGYMGIKKDEKLAKFMFYLSSFSFFMLFMVLSNDLLQLFVGWEGISLFSYFLISFLHQEKKASIAANKAFIINRVSDVSFLIGIFLTLQTFGTLNIDNIFNQLFAFQNQSITIFNLNINILTFIAFLFTIAAMGKSAQLFFQVWLPDAMEAPTPVSALLHAATMVTAGVYLLTRLSPLISSSVECLTFIVLIGGITAFLGASIAIVSTNIKKIIAYSTISQLGYMFLAIGSEFYNGAIFHVFTHAFFKGCLFLCAGIVIHRLAGEQNIYKMGALYKKMPIVYIATWISVLALCGIPPLSGFYSKEAILEQVFISNSYLSYFAYGFGLITVFLTAFYCFKLLILVFHGTPKYVEYHKQRSFTMTISVVILAFLSAVSGLTYKNFISNNGEHFWESSIIYNVVQSHQGIFINYLPLVLTLIGVFSAYLIYFKRYGMANNIATTFSNTYKFLVNKWYFDKLYEKVFVSNFHKASEKLTKIDNIVFNKFGVNLIARVIYRFSIILNKVQAGYIYKYIAVILLGLLVFLILILQR